MGSGKSESAKYETLVLRSLRHLNENGETRPGDIRLNKDELRAQLDILRNPDSSEHILACHVADIFGLAYTDVRRLADLGELGSEYYANSHIPKTDLPRIKTLRLRELSWDHRGENWLLIYKKATAALLAGDLKAAGWHIERIKRRDYSAYLAIDNLRLAYILATKTLEQLDEYERFLLEESSIDWGTTNTFIEFLNHITILDPRAEPLVRKLLKRPKHRIPNLAGRKRKRGHKPHRRPW